MNLEDLEKEELNELRRVNEEWKKMVDQERAKKISQILGIEIQTSEIGDDCIAIKILKHDNENGFCPNLLNDDSGRWAYFTEGIQTIADSEKAIDIESHFSVPEFFWKDTIAEAVCFGVFERGG